MVYMAKPYIEKPRRDKLCPNDIRPRDLMPSVVAPVSKGKTEQGDWDDEGMNERTGRDIVV